MEGLQKRTSVSLKEKGQYLLAFSVIASMLLVTNFPPLVIFFFAVFAYLLLKMFAAAGRSETRDIFEFYLASNEILRDDERRWFGFEIREAIARGESISRRMISPPPLLLFTVGALYNKMGDHKQAVAYLSQVMEGNGADELSLVHPSPELRSYVRVLRKIERDPGDAPLTSNAVRALERARRIRGNTILNESRALINGASPAGANSTDEKVHRVLKSVTDLSTTHQEDHRTIDQRSVAAIPVGPVSDEPGRRKIEPPRTQEERYSNRKSISEVLHDIYDTKAR